MRIFKQKPVRKMVAFFLCIVLLLGNTVTYAQGNGQAVEDQQYSQTAWGRRKERRAGFAASDHRGRGICCGDGPTTVPRDGRGGNDSDGDGVAHTHG